jgi:hypothetical protein
MLRRLTIAERTTLIVGALLITGMLSAVALDRMLAPATAPIVITMDRAAVQPQVLAVEAVR